MEKKAKKITKVLNFRVLFEQDEDGVFVATVPSLQGCYTQGDTVEEATENIKDVIDLHIASRKERGEMFDDSDMKFIDVKTISVPYGISSHN